MEPPFEHMRRCVGPLMGGGPGLRIFDYPADLQRDCDPVVCGVWKYLKRVSAKELMRLPSKISDVDELPSWVTQEAKWLIGFWFDKGLAEPAPRRSNWARQPIRSPFYWGEKSSCVLPVRWTASDIGKSLKEVTSGRQMPPRIGTLTRPMPIRLVAPTAIIASIGRPWRNGVNVGADLFTSAKTMERIGCRLSRFH